MVWSGCEDPLSLVVPTHEHGHEHGHGQVHVDIDIYLDIDIDTEHGHGHDITSDKQLWSLHWCANCKI
jgi:hypothetical protein